MANTTGAEERFLYDAFISYRHVQRDTRWADWLIAELERYRVPKSLQARGAPPKLRKVFRDQDEAYASADLNELIKEALKNSRRHLLALHAALEMGVARNSDVQ